MRAIVVDERGGPEVLRLEDVEAPRPGSGEILIEVAAAGVNFADVGIRAGMMGGSHAMELPYTPGFEVAGVVATVGRTSEVLRGRAGRGGAARGRLRRVCGGAGGVGGADP